MTGTFGECPHSPAARNPTIRPSLPAAEVIGRRSKTVGGLVYRPSMSENLLSAAVSALAQSVHTITDDPVLRYAKQQAAESAEVKSDLRAAGLWPVTKRPVRLPPVVRY